MPKSRALLRASRLLTLGHVTPWRSSFSKQEIHGLPGVVSRHVTQVNPAPVVASRKHLLSSVGRSYSQGLAAGLPSPHVSERTFSATWDTLKTASSRLLSNYYVLSKFRLSALVVSTAAVGFVAGSGEAVDMAGLAWVSAGTIMTAASANAFNQIMEVANDARMKRTMHRPLPAGRISRRHAIVWASAMGASGLLVLATQNNALTAELGASNLLLYTLVYTPLKQLHPVNTWVGAVVGGIPPLMGWAAAAGELQPPSWVLAGALYFWQIPHFMALAWLCKKDYSAGGYKMLSLLDKTGQRTAAAAFRNALYLAPLGLVAYQVGLTSEPFAYEALLMAAGMAASAWFFHAHPSVNSARQLFRASLLYLPLVMGALILHRNPNLGTLEELDRLEADEANEQLKLMDSWSPAPEDKDQATANGVLAAPSAVPVMAMYSTPPFPFLPLPTYVRV